ncbi:MAG TPA: GAF domain-containing protein [Ktedonosporobacter sp.]|jgi:hypothetical protein|nr:GAF domain-containing protein [Ktedonosporobacter sp.]
MNEPKPQTWRELLATLIADPQERQRIADAARVSPITLIRWSANRSNPRKDNLRPLLEAVAEYRQQLTELIAKEFPDFLKEFPEAETLMEIPSAFYARVLSAHTSSPPILRASTICILILQQIVVHLDPRLLGLAAVIMQCVPPAQGRKVRSLRQIQGRGTPPWMGLVENRTQFLGAESQTGMALQSGRAVTVQSEEVKSRLFPIHHTNLEKSSAVFPIIQSDRVAGCLCLASSLPNFFSQARLDLAKNYADLLVLAFEHGEFFDLQDVELGIMPSIQLQQERIAKFQQRVTQQMIRTVQNGQPITRPKAELLVWQELEEELLQISLNVKI